MVINFGLFKFVDDGKGKVVNAVSILVIREFGAGVAVSPRFGVTGAMANAKVFPEIVRASPFATRDCDPIMSISGPVFDGTVRVGSAEERITVRLLPAAMYGTSSVVVAVSPAKRDIGVPDMVVAGPLGRSVYESMMN